jgi:hypothetical protein
VLRWQLSGLLECAMSRRSRRRRSWEQRIPGDSEEPDSTRRVRRTIKNAAGDAGPRAQQPEDRSDSPDSKGPRGDARTRLRVGQWELKGMRRVRLKRFRGSGTATILPPSIRLHSTSFIELATATGAGKHGGLLEPHSCHGTGLVRLHRLLARRELDVADRHLRGAENTSVARGLGAPTGASSCRRVVSFV